MSSSKGWIDTVDLKLQLYQCYLYLSSSFWTGIMAIWVQPTTFQAFFQQRQSLEVAEREQKKKHIYGEEKWERPIITAVKTIRLHTH